MSFLYRQNQYDVCRKSANPAPPCNKVKRPLSFSVKAAFFYWARHRKLQVTSLDKKWRHLAAEINFMLYKQHFSHMAQFLLLSNSHKIKMIFLSCCYFDITCCLQSNYFAKNCPLFMVSETNNIKYNR